MTTATMQASFPEPPPKVHGTPTLRDFIRIMQHIMICSQSHPSQASSLGLLFVAIPQSLWSSYSRDQYPGDPVDPGQIPVLQQGMTAEDWANHKLQWDFLKKLHDEFKTMNAALVDRFLSLMQDAFTQEYKVLRISNPNHQFRECLDHFLVKYGATNETQREENKKNMKQPWNLQNG